MLSNAIELVDLGIDQLQMWCWYEMPLPSILFSGRCP